jgi:FkbM family methyltransferase
MLTPEPRGVPRAAGGRFTRTVNELRNSRAISLPARYVARPIVHGCDFVARELRRKIWVNGASVKYDGIDFSFPPGVGVHFASAIYWNGQRGFEPEVWLALSAFLATSDRFADVGANIGMYSLLAIKKEPAVDVVSFEPVQSLAEKHRKFMAANAVVGVRLVEAALSDRSGQGNVYIPTGVHVEEEQTASVDPSGWQALHPSSVQHSTALMRLDEYCEANDWWPNLVKVDVEGHELAVLRGAAKLLATRRPVVVCEVLRRAADTDVLRSLLNEYRYTSFAVCEAGLFQEDSFPDDRSFEYYAFLPGTDWPLFLSHSSLRRINVRALSG